MKLEQARNLAYSWHGGGGSPLYRFASTGQIQDEDHRLDLLREIRADLVWVCDNYREHNCGHSHRKDPTVEACNRREIKRLEQLIAFVKSAPVQYREVPA